MCYSGPDNTIEFSEGLNIILGANGYGKTKLYDAFNWVLFDHITDQEGRLSVKTNSIKEGLISRKALSAASSGDVVACSVTVEILNEAGKQIVLERTFSTEKTSGMEFSSSGKSSFSISEKDDFEYKPILLEDQGGIDEYIREHVIPPDILEHIWFQGERGIKNAVDTSNASKLKQVINKLSYIETWERFIQAADDTDRRTKKKYNEAIKRNNKIRDKASKLQQELETIEERLEQINEEIKINKNEVIMAEDRIDNLSMGESLREDLRKLRDDEVGLLQELASTQKDLDAILDNANRDLFDKSWIVEGTEHVATKFRELYEGYIYSKHEDRRRAIEGLPAIPKGNPTVAHLQKMLKDEHCNVCDRPAKEGSEAYKHIKRLLPENYPEVEDNFHPYHHEYDVQGVNRSVSVVSNYAESAQEEADEQTNKYFRLKNRFKQLEEENSKLEEQKQILLGRYNLESLESGVQQGEQYKSLSEKKAVLAKEIGKLEEKRTQLLENREEKSKSLGKLVDDDIDPVLIKQMKYFGDMLTGIEVAKEKQYNNLVNLLEQETNRHYAAINEKSGAFYGKVVFEPNTAGGYHPEIHNENGEDVTNGMNTSQLLAMQFSILFAILSANKEYGFNKRYPLIADAPNSAFDSKKKKDLLKQIGTTFEQSIVMMFEYLENDPTRANRYQIDKEGIRELIEIMKAEGIKVNAVMLDIPDGVNSRDINELTVQIKQV